MSINAFTAQGNTVAINVSTTASTPVRVWGNTSLGSYQYRVHGDPTKQTYIVITATPQLAVIPADGTPANAYPIHPNVVEVWSGPPNAYVSAITDSGTALLFVTPGDGK